MSAENHCPCMGYCPLENVLKLIGGKWKIRIICALSAADATRYNRLKREISGITNTMLATSLKELEEHGLVVRQQYPEMPVRVEYSLTESSRSLLPILQTLAIWETKTVQHPHREIV